MVASTASSLRNQSLGVSSSNQKRIISSMPTEPIATTFRKKSSCASRRGDRGLDQSERLGRIPVRGSDQAADLAALPVKQQRRRHANRLQRAEQFARGIGVELQMRGARLGQEALGLVAPAPVDIDRDRVEILAAELRL